MIHLNIFSDPYESENIKVLDQYLDNLQRAIALNIQLLTSRIQSRIGFMLLAFNQLVFVVIAILKRFKEKT